jgi:hypothetical protein
LRVTAGGHGSVRWREEVREVTASQRWRGEQEGFDLQAAAREQRGRSLPAGGGARAAGAWPPNATAAAREQRGRGLPAAAAREQWERGLPAAVVRERGSNQHRGDRVRPPVRKNGARPSVGAWGTAVGGVFGTADGGGVGRGRRWGKAPVPAASGR